MTPRSSGQWSTLSRSMVRVELLVPPSRWTIGIKSKPMNWHVAGELDWRRLNERCELLPNVASGGLSIRSIVGTGQDSRCSSTQGLTQLFTPTPSSLQSSRRRATLVPRSSPPSSIGCPFIQWRARAKPGCPSRGCSKMSAAPQEFTVTTLLS